jgi:hypothetical protein
VTRNKAASKLLSSTWVECRESQNSDFVDVDPFLEDVKWDVFGFNNALSDRVEPLSMKSRRQDAPASQQILSFDISSKLSFSPLFRLFVLVRCFFYTGSRR